jgi:cobyrinic acid a,c-diamide synthase
MATRFSRLVIAGLSGNSGKTIACLSLLTALKNKGLSVSVFKKGPDYIDPAWLSQAAGAVCRNLDTYMVDREEVLRSFVASAGKTDISVIEGNRGIHDGKDIAGSHSTAELAKLLSAPVVLVVDVSRVTRTVAAIVRGCVDFDPGVHFAGVILNRVAGRRHLQVIKDSLRQYCDLPVLGAIPNLGDEASPIPSRHLGLVTPAEFKSGVDFHELLSEIADKHLEVDKLIEASNRVESLTCSEVPQAAVVSGRVKIGYFRDSVFTFYYPENLEALEAEGAELVPISSLDDSHLPDIDALYIGGGFPETHADQLAQNGSMMESVRKAAMNDLPIYAECGGLIYLAESLSWNDKVYRMAGLFPIKLDMHSKPVGHGYTQVRVDRSNPFFAVGTSIKGHEFHYSGLTDMPKETESCMEVRTGVGIGDSRDGLVYRNVLGCYLHIHASGVEEWAGAMVSRAADYRSKHSIIDSAGDEADTFSYESSGRNRNSGVALSTRLDRQLQFGKV